MINCSQLRELIIKPALDSLQAYSNSAEELLVFTCATESLGGTFLKQVKGPALGIYQMEPATYSDLWANYIRGSARLMHFLLNSFNCPKLPFAERMIYDLNFATAMARIFYLRFPEVLPDSKDIEAIWEYYKKYWNTNKGKAKKEESIEKYHRYIKS